MRSFFFFRALQINYISKLDFRLQGLDYPGVGPEHAWMKDMNRATYCAVTDKQALEGFLLMTRLEGIYVAGVPSCAQLALICFDPET